MIDWIINTYSDSGVVQFFFWGPVVFNAIVYPYYIWARVQDDRKTIREWEEKFREAKLNNSYKPILYTSGFVTVGSIVKYFFCTITPIINALATFFHTGPIAFDILSNRFAWLFTLKLVKTPNPRAAEE